MPWQVIQGGNGLVSDSTNSRLSAGPVITPVAWESSIGKCAFPNDNVHEIDKSDLRILTKNQALETRLGARYGIEFEFTEPYTPSQKGPMERLNRLILEVARALLFDSRLPKIILEIRDGHS